MKRAGKVRPRVAARMKSKDVDSPPLTAAQLAAMRPAREVVPEIVRAARGRPPKAEDERKKLVTLRLDAEVIDRFRARGPGWQTRINDVLRRAVRLKPDRKAAGR
jgi:uncharacterized protein (DUF4415 family)